MGAQLEKAKRRLAQKEQEIAQREQELALLQDERATLLGGVAYFEAYEDKEEEDNHSQIPLPVEPGKGTVAKAVRMVVASSKGRPMTTAEIWSAAQALGASSASSDPLAVVTQALSRIKGMEKVGRARWQLRQRK